MKKIVVASKNPVKISAVEQSFKMMFAGEEFKVSGVSVPSGVSDQPKTDKETYLGALNRANNAFNLDTSSDFWVGIEGGLEARDQELEVFAWVVIRSKENKYGKGRSATFFLPNKIAELVKSGKELGDASDEVFGENNLKQKQGTIGLLTGNIIDRTKYYIDPVVMALVPFKNNKFF